MRPFCIENFVTIGRAWGELSCKRTDGRPAGRTWARWAANGGDDDCGGDQRYSHTDDLLGAQLHRLPLLIRPIALRAV